MQKCEIAHFEQFHLFPQYFPKALFFYVLKRAYMEERVKPKKSARNISSLVMIDTYGYSHQQIEKRFVNLIFHRFPHVTETVVKDDPRKLGKKKEIMMCRQGRREGVQPVLLRGSRMNAISRSPACDDSTWRTIPAKGI